MVKVFLIIMVQLMCTISIVRGCVTGAGPSWEIGGGRPSSRRYTPDLARSAGSKRRRPSSERFNSDLAGQGGRRPSSEQFILDLVPPERRRPSSAWFDFSLSERLRPLSARFDFSLPESLRPTLERLIPDLALQPGGGPEVQDPDIQRLPTKVVRYFAGNISKEEAFAAIDIDGDGLVSSNEWTSGGGEWMDFNLMLIRLDTNGDGLISLVELQPYSLPTESNSDISPRLTGPWIYDHRPRPGRPVDPRGPINVRSSIDRRSQSNPRGPIARDPIGQRELQ